MRLTVFTEYALLVLAYLARHQDRFVTISEIAGAHGISANHLMKVAQHLAASGDVETLRGPRGGLRLARTAVAIRVGDVVRGTERELLSGAGRGVLAGSVLDRAVAAFMAVLDECTVADLMEGVSARAVASGLGRKRRYKSGAASL
jgi:Rrf2 family nitric oxide-sensitive transcriptional repressor